MGGKAYDTGRSACLGPNGSLYVTGAADREGRPAQGLGLPGAAARVYSSPQPEKVSC
jgi:hypothetical protein